MNNLSANIGSIRSRERDDNNRKFMKIFCVVCLLNPYGLESQKEMHMFYSSTTLHIPRTDYSILDIAPLYLIEESMCPTEHSILICFPVIIIGIIYTHFG